MKEGHAMVSITEKADCCGCTACAKICVNSSIAIKPDNEGFLYPVVNATMCNDCGLCDSVCPVLNANKEKIFQQNSYIVNNKDEAVRGESTSGGAFTPIAQYIIENGGVVFGASFDEQFNVCHTYVESCNELYKFRGSKYVQSDMGDSYIHAKAFLDAGRLVCFSGTPCQIEGLLCFLQKDYINLYTVDVVCRSVPSPLLWKKFLTYKKNKFNSSPITSVSFRDKSRYGYQYPNIYIKAGNKQYYAGAEADPFMRSFIESVTVRPSCYECNFKKRYRHCDFTIWDCGFPEKFDRTLDDNKGTTCVLIHTEKGKDLFNKIKSNFRYKEVPPDEIVKGVKEMFERVPCNKKRKMFFSDLKKLSEKELFDKYFPSSVKITVIHHMKKFLAKTNLYKKVKRIAKKKAGR